MTKEDMRANKEKWGPKPYESLGSTVAKFRRLAMFRELTWTEKMEYGTAVSESVCKAQRAALARAYAPIPKIEVGLTSIARLSRYENPLKMVGDPKYKNRGYDAWNTREQVIYAHAIAEKNKPGANYVR